MYYVYVLRSTLKTYFYTGYTDNLKKRLSEHNNGKVKSTLPYKPFELIYYEACLDEKDAYSREKYLKSRLGKSYLRKRLRNWFQRYV